MIGYLGSQPPGARRAPTTTTAMRNTTMSTNSRPKTVCPVTRGQFTAKAEPQQVLIGGQPVLAQVHQFSTGSMGFYANAKVTIVIDGVPCVCQVGLNITLVGSKELPAAVPTTATEAA